MGFPLQREGNTLAKNAKAYEKTMDNMDQQLGDAITNGEFTKAEELFATATGLQSSVARANEEIVGGKFMFEAGMLDEARYAEATTTAAYLNQMERQVNAQIEARVHELERVHQNEREELEQLLQDKVRLEFTPTPEMLDLKAKVEFLLASQQFDRAEFTRQNLIKQERGDRKVYAESLWRIWGQRRNKLAYKQSLERARCESDISARKAHFSVQKKEFFKIIDRKHQYHLQLLQSKFTNVNNHAKVEVRNKTLRLPPVDPKGSIPLGNEERHRPGEVQELPSPVGKVLYKSYLHRKSSRFLQQTAKNTFMVTKPDKTSTAGVLAPAGRMQYYTKRNQSAGGTVAAFKWDRLYVVLAKLSGLHIYSSEDAFVNGQSALAHVRLTDGELRLLNETDEDRNFQPMQLVFELVNATYSQVNPETGEQMRAISGLTFRTETKHDYEFWVRHLNKLMRTFGQVEPMLKVANRFKKTQTLRPKSTTPGASSPMSMSMDQAGPRSNTAMGEYDARTDQALTTFVGTKPVSWTRKAFKPRWH